MSEMNLFNVMEVSNGEKVKAHLLKEFEHFGIDEIYRQKCKGKGMPYLQIVKTFLNNDTDRFREYKNKLLKRLTELLPQSEEYFSGNSLYVKNGEIRGWQIKGLYAPIYCIEMIDSRVFSEVKL